jgi:hypothetical protein
MFKSQLCFNLCKIQVLVTCLCFCLYESVKHFANVFPSFCYLPLTFLMVGGPVEAFHFKGIKCGGNVRSSG